MSIALIGPSGVGKGTHALQLIEKFDMLYLVTGDLLRENLKQHTAVGFLAQRHVKQGELVPDEVVDAMVAEWVWRASPDKNILFDGFPRTVDQARFLDEFFIEVERQLDAVIYLEISDDAVAQRLAGRVVCSECQTPYHRDFKPPLKPGVCDLCAGEVTKRADDIPEVIRVRLRGFRRALDPVLDYYRESNRLITIDGDGSVQEVGQAVIEAVERLQIDGRPQTAPGKSTTQSPKHEKSETVSVSEVTDASFNLVLVGGPGSGKGTQAEQLQAHLDLPHIATGDLFRENLSKKTDLGMLAKSYMDKGALVPDDVTEAMVEERMARSDAKAGFILDGFPRTLPQAQALTDIMNAANRRITGAIYIRVSDEEIVRRLSGRLICRDCQTPFHVDFKPPALAGVCDNCKGELYQRDDDNPNTIRARLKTFHGQTGPVVNYYRDAGLLIEIDGEGEVSDVITRSKSAVDKLSSASTSGAS